MRDRADAVIDPAAGTERVKVGRLQVKAFEGQGARKDFAGRCLVFPGAAQSSIESRLRVAAELKSTIETSTDGGHGDNATAIDGPEW